MKAFSLIELSIVLVILGLLTGGILAGKSLIHASELRAVNTEYTRYITAMASFRDKYFGIPGDLTNAQAFWGVDPGGCPGDSTTGTRTAQTCNGDGNGQILNTAATANEIFRFWQHLANAGLIEGIYTGTSSGAATTIGCVTGYNSPASRLNKGLWSIIFIGNKDISSGGYFEGSYGNALTLATGTSCLQTFLIPEDAWNIDTKFDDGLPGTGAITTYENQGSSAGTGCSNQDGSTSVSVAANSAYSLTNSNATCSFLFKTKM